MAQDLAVHYALLNAAQKRAVDHVDGPMLVLAGAGTGKTQIIALRIAKLLQQADAQPQQILCLTFTESGVSAMRQRLIDLIGETGYHVRIATFHSFCNEIIQEHPELFFVDAELDALRDIERIQLFQEIIDTLPADSPLKPFGAPYYYLNDCAKTIQTLKRENVTPKRYRALLKSSAKAVAQLKPAKDATLTAQRKFKTQQRQFDRQQALADVYDRYVQKLQQWHRYDYEDMLLSVVEQFSAQPDLLADYQERYQYILVDEYQDTNGAQNEIVRLLASGVDQPNIFVVGDDRQSIYRFQGASLENILYFQKLFGRQVKIVSLQDNYRSQQFILDAAEGVIANNKHSLAAYIPTLPTRLRAARDLPEEKISVAAFTTRPVEEYWVVEQIKVLLANGVPANEIAVLYRTNADMIDVFEYCVQQQIPVHNTAGANVLDDLLIAQLLRVMKYIGLQGSDEELFHIMQFQWLNLPGAAVAKLVYQSYQLHQWLFETALTAEEPAVRQFAEKMVAWRQLSQNRLLSEWFVQIVNESGWMQHVLALPHQVEALNRLQTLFTEMKQLNRTNTKLSLRDLFSYFALLEEHHIVLREQGLASQRQAVQFMTAHRAKGLEFEHVFMIHCQDKQWGNNRDRSKIRLPSGILHVETEADLADQANEDERRLFYVALTRAKQRVHISYAQTAPSGRALMPSQFIQELPVDMVDQVDTAAAEQATAQRLQSALVAPGPVTVAAADDDAAWLKARLEHYRMSATHYNDYIECQRKFYYQHILRVPQATSRAVGYGIAVHNALRDASSEYLTTNQLPTKRRFMQRFTWHLQKQLLSKKDAADSLAFGQATLVEYYDAHREVIMLNAFPEYDFAPYHVMVGPVPITGKIDAMQVLDKTSKTVHVIDYKTGNPDNKGTNLAKGGPYHRQLLFYKLLVDGAPQFGHTAVSGEIHFTQKSKQKDEFISRTYEFKDADVLALKGEIQRVYAEIMALHFLQPGPDQVCGECTYCLLAEQPSAVQGVTASSTTE